MTQVTLQNSPVDLSTGAFCPRCKAKPGEKIPQTESPRQYRMYRCGQCDFGGTWLRMAAWNADAVSYMVEKGELLVCAGCKRHPMVHLNEGSTVQEYACPCDRAPYHWMSIEKWNECNRETPAEATSGDTLVGKSSPILEIPEASSKNILLCKCGAAWVHVKRTAMWRHLPSDGSPKQNDCIYKSGTTFVRADELRQMHEEVSRMDRLDGGKPIPPKEEREYDDQLSIQHPRDEVGNLLKIGDWVLYNEKDAASGFEGVIRRITGYTWLGLRKSPWLVLGGNVANPCNPIDPQKVVLVTVKVVNKKTNPA